MRDFLSRNHGQYEAFHVNAWDSYIAFRDPTDRQWRLSRTETSSEAEGMMLHLLGYYDHLWEVEEVVQGDAQKRHQKRLGVWGNAGGSTPDGRTEDAGRETVRSG